MNALVSLDTLPVERLAVGFVLSTAIGLAAYWRGALSLSGIAGAILTGTLIFGFGGWTMGLLLIAFFVSSSWLSHVKKTDPRKQRAAEMFEKGGRRDLGQALANGGAAAGFSTLGWVLGAHDPALAAICYACAVGALCTVNADTWATELGVLSPSPPRLITRLSQVVPTGTSGGVTVAGTGAALGGAAFIAACSVAFQGIFGDLLPSQQWASLAAAAIVGGVGGSLFDSALGATVQAIYYSERRQKETARAHERDGTRNRHVRGWRWLNNDWVNFLSSLFGAFCTAALFSPVIWNSLSATATSP